MSKALVIFSLLYWGIACNKEENSLRSEESSSDTEIDEIEVLDQDNEEDDFIIAGAPAYVTGTNLITPEIIATEIGGHGREVKLVAGGSGSFIGELPHDGYFKVQMGDKFAVVTPFSGGLKFGLARYHAMTAKLLQAAYDMGAVAVFESGSIDIGLFSYVGQAMYRAARRNGDVVNETTVKLIAGMLRSTNLAVYDKDPVGFSNRIRAKIRELYVETRDGKAAFIAFREFSSSVSGEESSPSVQGFVKRLVDISASNPLVKEILIEINYAEIFSQVTTNPNMPTGIREGVIVNVWRNIQAADIESLEIGSKTSVAAKLIDTALLLEEEATKADLIANNLAKKRVWRESSSFVNEDITFIGGRLTTGEHIGFVFIGAPTSEKIVRENLVANIYFKSYKYGYWSPETVIATDIRLASDIPYVTCRATDCFVAWQVGVTKGEGISDRGLANYAKTAFTVAYVNLSDGTSKILKTIDANQFEMGLSSKAGAIEIATVSDGQAIFVTLDRDGKMDTLTTFHNENIELIQSYTSGGESLWHLLGIGERQYDYWENPATIWTHFIRLSGQTNIFEIDTAPVFFGHLLSFDIEGKKIGLTLGDIYPIDPDAVDKVYYSTFKSVSIGEDGTFTQDQMGATTATSHWNRITGDARMGRFVTCGITEDKWIFLSSEAMPPYNRLYGNSLNIATDAGLNYGTILDEFYMSRGTAVCDFVPGFFWQSGDGTYQSVKFAQLFDSVISEPIEIVRRGEMDSAIGAFTPLGTKFGFYGAFVVYLPKHSVKQIWEIETDSIDASVTESLLYLYE